MGKVASALGLDMGDEAPASEPMETSMDDESAEEKPKGPVSAEVLAMKAFDRATSPEQKAQALKDFLSACGVYDE